MAQDPNAYLWIVGVVLVLLGSLGQNLGNNIVSLSHTRKKKEIQRQKTLESEQLTASAKMDLEKGTDVAEKGVAPPEAQKPTLLWYVGTTSFVLGSLLTFAAFGFAAQSLLASLESIQFVSNVLFAKFVHGENVTRRMCLATTAIVAGNVLVVVFSTHEADILTSYDIIDLYVTNQAFWGYLIGSFVIWVTCEGLFYRYHKARVKEGKVLWKHDFIEPFAYVTSSAIIGAAAVLNSKCLSMLIQVSVRGMVNEFTRAPLWIILLTWILFVAYWLRRLDKGLELFPPLFFIPVIQVAFMFLAIVIGGIFFEEFFVFALNQWLGFCVGVFLILVGVYGLAPTDVDMLSVVPVDFDPSLEAVVGKAVVTPAPSPTQMLTGLEGEGMFLDDEIKAKGLGMGGAADLEGKAAFEPREKPQPLSFSSSSSAAPANASANASASASASTGPQHAAPSTPVKDRDNEDGTQSSKTPGSRGRKVIKHGSTTPQRGDRDGVGVGAVPVAEVLRPTA